MKIFTLLTTCLLLFFTSRTFAQCTTGQSTVVVSITPDNYPSETSWTLTSGGTEIASGTTNSGTYCVPDGQCLIFTINDAYGDGICCGYGNGSYSVTLNGATVASGGSFAYAESTNIGCPQGTYCANPLPLALGNTTAPQNNTYYIFAADTTGMYEFTTCGTTTCDTKIWIYQSCTSYSTAATNVGTAFYDDNDGGCGLQARVTAYMAVGDTFIVRIGLGSGSCANIPFQVNYLGPITGCMDESACNFEPLATLPGQCYYYPDPNCPAGPDLVIDEAQMISSLVLGQVTAENCAVVEGCLNGYGTRDVLRFDTHIRNNGETDYFIGNPTANPSQFTFGNCHGHAHYEGYAKYDLYKTDGTMIPIGQKNGFCVLDLECGNGGTAQYGCGNMGISHGCGDIYGAYLDCQWIDITDVDTGQYVLRVKVNWDHSPDALGRHEMTYDNNIAQACIHITRVNGVTGYELLPDCQPFIDCAGIPYGTTEIDCAGDCGGSAMRGDMNNDQQISLADAQAYVNSILDGSALVNECKDISADGIISVWDAGLTVNCSLNSNITNNCDYPISVTNQSQLVNLGYTTINTAEGYIDVYVMNPNARLTGYEFNVSGITVADAVNLVDNLTYPMTPQFQMNGTKVIGLTMVDSTIPKNTVPTPMVRLYYSSITDPSNICVSGIVHILNTLYEPTNTVLTLPCISILGVTEQELTNVSIFPNPATDLLTVKLGSSLKGIATVSVTDLNGKVLTSKKTDGKDTVEIDVKHLAAGTYQIVADSSSRRFVKQ